ncbi:hypothetical protein LG3211_0276 [Lysobacter gummosus]|nr:hypothetical protein LG3211_0276 [Lysobacter gummosus]
MVMIDNGWPPAYTEAACTFGGTKVFEAAAFQADVACEHRRRDDRYGSDWEEIADLLTESCRVLAPKNLAVLLDQFGD